MQTGLCIEYPLINQRFKINSKWTIRLKKERVAMFCIATLFSWAHLGLNQGPPDYESGALTS